MAKKTLAQEMRDLAYKSFKKNNHIKLESIKNSVRNNATKGGTKLLVGVPDGTMDAFISYFKDKGFSAYPEYVREKEKYFMQLKW
jgi:hypothetical protein